jgi:hypothetical protein
MKIIVGKTLKEQPKEFVDMVTNAKPGDIFIHSFADSIIFSHDLLDNPQHAIFIVESVEPITTRFDSRDRILRGGKYRFRGGGYHLEKRNKDLVFVKKESLWCSQLAGTEKYNESN